MKEEDSREKEREREKRDLRGRGERRESRAK